MIQRKVFFRGHDEYLSTVSNAYELLIFISKQVKYVNRCTNFCTNRFRQGQNKNFLFAQKERHRNQKNINSSEVLNGRDGVTHETVW